LAFAQGSILHGEGDFLAEEPELSGDSVGEAEEAVAAGGFSKRTRRRSRQAVLASEVLVLGNKPE